MKVYVATISTWEDDGWVLGVYSTREKAEQRCLEQIQKETGMTFASLEEYDAMDESVLDPDGGYSIWDWSVKGMTVDK